MPKLTHRTTVHLNDEDYVDLLAGIQTHGSRNAFIAHCIRVARQHRTTCEQCLDRQLADAVRRVSSLTRN